MFKYLMLFVSSISLGASCCGSLADVRTAEAYRVSTAVVEPRINPVDMWRTQSYLEAYMRDHPKQVSALKEEYKGNSTAISAHIIRSHLRSPSRHIDALKPAMTSMIDNS